MIPAARAEAGPLLVGPDRDAALEAIRCAQREVREEGREAGPLLGNGQAGAAVFLHHARAVMGDVDEAVSDALWEDVIAGLEALTRGPSLFVGFVGNAWAYQHALVRSGAAAPDDLDPVDEALIAYLERGPSPGFDLISGITGIGVYALERAPHGRWEDLARAVTRRLRQRARLGPEGACFWETDAVRADGSPIDGGAARLGLAHGSGGPMVFLAEALHLGLDDEGARGLLGELTRWVLARARDEGPAFDWEVDARDVGEPARPGWCYGEPGVSLSLLWAARALQDDAIERRAIALAHRAAALDVEMAEVALPSLCHGAAAQAHLFHRLYRATGDVAFAERARAWARRVLRDVPPQVGPRFLVEQRDADGRAFVGPHAGLLVGASGVGLVLASALDPGVLGWDRVLGVHVPPRSP